MTNQSPKLTSDNASQFDMLSIQTHLQTTTSNHQPAFTELKRGQINEDIKNMLGKACSAITVDTFGTTIERKIRVDFAMKDPITESFARFSAEKIGGVWRFDKLDEFSNLYFPESAYPWLIERADEEAQKQLS